MMGDLTRLDLVDEVKRNLGNRSTAGGTDITSRVIRHLNIAQNRIARKHPFRELNKVDSVSISITGTLAVDKVHQFSAALNLREIHSLIRVFTDERPFKLIGKPHRQWSQIVGVSDEFSVGDPTHYNEWEKGKIEFWRIPNRAFTLVRKYLVWPANLTSDTQVSDLYKKDDVIIAYATSSLFDSLGQREDAGKFFAVGNALYQDAYEEDLERIDDTTIPENISEDDVGPGNYIIDPFVRRAP